MYCSGIFNAGRTEAQIDADELHGIYSEYDAIVPTLKARVNRNQGHVTVALDPALPPRRAEWRSQRGCRTLPIGLRDGPREMDNFPQYPQATYQRDPRRWPFGDGDVRPRPSQALKEIVTGAFGGVYGTGAKTVGVVILRDGNIVAEQYRDGFGPFVSNRTWSVAKSFAGALFGYRQAQGRADVTKPVSIYEWGMRTTEDPRVAITNEQLLRMSSGLYSDTAGNRTDAIYFGGTAVVDGATGWPLAAMPGTRFRYANNDILLAMLSLQVSGRDPVAFKSLPHDFFWKLDMRRTVAETDWRDDFIISSQVWSTARDFARFGLFLSQDGVWNGERLLPAGWVAESIRPTGPQPASGPGYGRTLWLFGPKQGLPEGSYAAQGNRGQYIMIIPSQKLIVVRRGEDPGPARFDIAKFAADVAATVK